MESDNRPIEELWIEEYYRMDPERVNENTKIHTDYGDLVSLLTSFKELYASQFKREEMEKDLFAERHLVKIKNRQLEALQEQLTREIGVRDGLKDMYDFTLKENIRLRVLLDNKTNKEL